MMRRILVDYARNRRYAKRGGNARQVSLDEAAIVSGGTRGRGGRARRRAERSG
jgi:hypothetical protein